MFTLVAPPFAPPVKARDAQGLESVPVGLIQSAIGGSQIEAWMDNSTRSECKNQSLAGGTDDDSTYAAE